MRSETLSEARATHPRLMEQGHRTTNAEYRCQTSASAIFSDALPEPDAPSEASFEVEKLAQLRAFARAAIRQTGLTPSQAQDFILAINEIATNGLRYGGGVVTLRFWEDADRVICEVQDTAGHLHDPLAGRRHPSADQESGRGLWIANQVCDLVQIHLRCPGSVVRLHMRRR